MAEKAKQPVDPECTFQPRINPISSRRRSRSVVELSRGDALKRETAQRLMKVKMEQDELADLTFQPKLNKSVREVQPTIRVTSDPDG